MDALALAALRVHLQAELDLRAVFRSEGDPADVLTRAERVAARVVEVLRGGVLMARTLVILSPPTSDELKWKVAEQVGAMHLLLLARISGWACLSYFCRRGQPDAVETGRIVGGLIPTWLDLEADIAALFSPQSDAAGIPAA